MAHAPKWFQPRRWWKQLPFKSADPPEHERRSEDPENLQRRNCLTSPTRCWDGVRRTSAATKPRDASACDNHQHRHRHDMDKRTLERFRKLLTARRDELQDRLAAAKQHSRHIADDAKDEGDRATATVSAEMTAAQQAQNERLLGGISAALLRIEHGTFGECAQCGQEIGGKRLEAVPWTRFCITCQE